MSIAKRAILDDADDDVSSFKKKAKYFQANTMHAYAKSPNLFSTSIPSVSLSGGKCEHNCVIMQLLV